MQFGKCDDNAECYINGKGPKDTACLQGLCIGIGTQYKRLACKTKPTHVYTQSKYNGKTKCQLSKQFGGKYLLTVKN